MEIQDVGVIGAGTMGHGIAQVLAMAGIKTRLFDVAPAAVDAGLAKIQANLDKGVARGKVEEKARVLALEALSGASELSVAVEGAEVVIEAAPERMDLKQSIFSDLSELCAPDALLATNTSSLSITEIGQVCSKPERVVGMHFFNPVHIMKLVEVARTDASSDEAVTCAMELARRMGKEPIVASTLDHKFY